METTLTPTGAALRLGTAFAAWERLPQVADALGKPGALHLVIDPMAGQILHASTAARALSEGLAGRGLADLSRQVMAAAPTGTVPRLARLRLDPRRIAPPVLCWLARGSQENGGPAVLVIPTGPVSSARAGVPRSTAPSVSEARQTESPEAEELPRAVPKREDRFLWRVDATGILTTCTGPDGLSALVGRRVEDLAAAGRIADAEGMLAALRARRTFRSERAVLNAGSGAFAVELSGAPLGRSEAAYSGFGGFGLIRSGPALAGMAAPEVAPASTASPPQAVETAPPEIEAAPDGIEASTTTLSNDEHAAFREIARALGARYAGDDVGADAEAPRPVGGAIMPFPGSQSGQQETRGRTAPAPDAGILAGLPLPALVLRGDAILAANSGLLALTGRPDLEALAATGLGGLFPGLPPRALTAEPDAGSPRERAMLRGPGAVSDGIVSGHGLQPGADLAPHRTTLVGADGRARAVEVLSGRCSWENETAECLIVRPLEEADLAGSLEAERLARIAQTERAASAEAALDALESGVVTVDGAARIVAVNRAAADLFACDPREIVGGSFIALFDRESALTIADLLRGTVRAPRVVSVAGRPVALDVRAARSEGHRVAVIDGPAQRRGLSASDAPGAPGTAPALGRLDSAFREPLTGMIALADAMLKEPFGPLGDARYSGCLSEIRNSGAAMLERVGKLLDLATVEAGSLRLEPRPLDLNDVAAECVARLQAQAAQGRIVMRTSFSTDLDNLEADERSVSRAASLVIEHAIRRSIAGGQIIVSTGSAEQAAIALRVRDTGAGAASAIAAPGSDVEDVLALPRALVEANGGRLQLSAKAEDGTLVEIIMPTRRAVNG